MRTTGTIAEIREFLAGARREPVTVGLVPTMGALHEGHLSLLTRAREQCDVVVVSLFVNPTQFDDPGDLASYPRDTQRDSELAAAAGADVLFAPAEGEMYRAGTRTTVRVADITETLEGASRGSAHFDAVATVVTKLLHIVSPDVAYFGQKDAQQVAVVRRLVADLDMAVRIEVCPIVRASDGVALSSRNMLLSADERERARGLNRALLAAQDHVAGRPARRVGAARRRPDRAGTDGPRAAVCGTRGPRHHGAACRAGPSRAAGDRRPRGPRAADRQRPARAAGRRRSVDERRLARGDGSSPTAT